MAHFIFAKFYSTIFFSFQSTTIYLADLFFFLEP